LQLDLIQILIFRLVSIQEGFSSKPLFSQNAGA
jgi:hypothetical protein